MSAWSLVLIPMSLGLVIGMLTLVSWFEQRVLSRPALIRYSIRSRHMGADTVELFIARQSEPLLRGVKRP